MGKIDVSGNLATKLGIGFVALFFLIIFGGLIIAGSKNINEEDGLLLSLSHATRIDTQEFTQSSPLTIITYLVLAFGGEVLAFYVFYVLIEFLISGQFKDNIAGVAKMSKIKSMRGHHIVCGGGRVGQHLAEKLKLAGEEVIIVENDETKVLNLQSLGYVVMNADALNEDTFKALHINYAESLAAVLGNDGDNLLTILSAREMNPKLLIATRSNDELIVPKLKHAGADIVILPEVIGGIKLAEAILGDVDEGHVIHHKRKPRQENIYSKHIPMPPEPTHKNKY